MTAVRVGSPRGTRRVAIVFALMLLAALAPASMAAAGNSGYLRLAHLSPDTPSVDVYVTSVSDPSQSLMIPGVGYGAVSGYRSMTPGIYSVTMRPAGAPKSSPPVISTTIHIGQGTAHTVAGVGSFAHLGLQVLTDDLSLPPHGQSRLRIVQASADQPRLDIALDRGRTMEQNVSFATTTPYSLVDAGSHTIQVTGTGGKTQQLHVSLRPGAVYSVLVLDGKSGLTVSAHLDAASTGVVPTGGINTGAGGTAGTPLTVPIAAVAAGLALLALAGAALRRDRRVC